MSSVYLDVLKDRLYTFHPDSQGRRSAQTVLHQILLSFIKILFPILSFTTEDLWQALPVSLKETVSVQLCEWPVLEPESKADEAFQARWEKLLSFREKVYAKMEEARKEKVMRQPLEASVEATLPTEEYRFFLQDTGLLKDLLIVSKLTLKEEPGQKEAQIRVAHAPGEKCVRCWHYEDKLSAEPYPGLCYRCVPVVEKLSLA